MPINPLSQTISSKSEQNFYHTIKTVKTHYSSLNPYAYAGNSPIVKSHMNPANVEPTTTFLEKAVEHSYIDALRYWHFSIGYNLGLSSWVLPFEKLSIPANRIALTWQLPSDSLEGKAAYLEGNLGYHLYWLAELFGFLALSVMPHICNIGRMWRQAAYEPWQFSSKKHQAAPLPMFFLCNIFVSLAFLTIMLATFSLHYLYLPSPFSMVSTLIHFILPLPVLYVVISLQLALYFWTFCQIYHKKDQHFLWQFIHQHLASLELHGVFKTIVHNSYKIMLPLIIIINLGIATLIAIPTSIYQGLQTSRALKNAMRNQVNRRLETSPFSRLFWHWPMAALSIVLQAIFVSLNLILQFITCLICILGSKNRSKTWGFLGQYMFGPICLIACATFFVGIHPPLLLLPHAIVIQHLFHCSLLNAITAAKVVTTGFASLWLHQQFWDYTHSLQSKLCSALMIVSTAALSTLASSFMPTILNTLFGCLFMFLLPAVLTQLYPDDDTKDDRLQIQSTQPSWIYLASEISEQIALFGPVWPTFDLKNPYERTIDGVFTL